MPTPMRIPAGFTQDNPTQPLAFMGQPDPFFYNTFYNDFNVLLPANARVLSAGAGSNTPTFAQLTGDGGLVQLGTGATTPAAGNLGSVQLATATFTAPTNGKRMFFLTRIATNLASTNVVRTGVSAVTTDPFTTPPDGIYFSKATAATGFTVQVVAGGGVTGSVVVPASAVTLSNTAFVDLGFEISPQGEVKVFAGTNLVGFRPQSGTATQTTPPPAGGPVARFTPTAFPTVALTPFHAVQTQTAAAATLNIDFVLVAKER